MKNFSEQKQNRIMAVWQAAKCVIKNPQVRHCERSEAISWFLEIATDSKCHCPRNDEECLLHFRKIYKGAVRPRNEGKRKAVVVC